MRDFLVPDLGEGLEDATVSSWSVAVGDEVISGCVNLSGLLRVKVSKPYAESTVARILDLVENASGK